MSRRVGAGRKGRSRYRRRCRHAGCGSVAVGRYVGGRVAQVVRRQGRASPHIGAPTTLQGENFSALADPALAKLANLCGRYSLAH